MKYINNAIFLSILVLGCTAQNLKQAKKAIGDALSGNKLSTEEVVKGLKEALVQGTTKGTNQVSRVDGYFKNPSIKIPFPPDIQKVEKKLRNVGLGNKVDKFIETLNRGAEEAAKEAKPIFVNAITSMTVNDAWSILKGADNSATSYLNKTTSGQLKIKFKPIVRKALDKTSATKYYSDMIKSYNKIPFVEKVNPNLDDYATDRAIAGLFVMIEKEEKNIRDNPGARATDLLKRVFNQQD